MGTIIRLHGGLANATVLFMVVCGLWGLANYLRGLPLGPNLKGSLVIGELLILTQGALGVALLLVGLRPAGSIHILYGVLSALTLPGVYLIPSSSETDKGESLKYGVTCLFIAGLALRAITTV
jgi:hypothetical protein